MSILRSFRFLISKWSLLLTVHYCRLDRIERDIIEKRVTLLIIDSLASVIRRDFTGACVSTLHERAIYLSKISSKLKTIAEILDVSILLTNQITTFTQLTNPSDKRSNKGIPANRSKFELAVGLIECLCIS